MKQLMDVARCTIVDTQLQGSEPVIKEFIQLNAVATRVIRLLLTFFRPFQNTPFYSCEAVVA
jgi:hypothetical protein